MLDVIFFGSLRERVGCDRIQFEIDQPMTVQAVIDTLLAQSEQWQPLVNRRMLCAVNQEVANFNAQVCPGDELALFPPVTGG
ncbi:MoaD/ThiS family protein [Marinobacter persicus]|jgi:molybdopterin converting factor subunit 1|uniref:Molybdopterin synthase sulfur carrier subunit n=1 Tax=Marinobacter persicus TaxID=930118 RepID=A0A2S6G5Q7_9GAMM|nr:molybdopterin synthase subunit MoaD [Marinobacter persicus]PPK54451.1 molybdopterin synthase subunit MoaD [Marinobacter persicus]PPK57590.1 molybdopterin synthase subunit MoaD [Marinobacter persicus]